MDWMNAVNDILNAIQAPVVADPQRYRKTHTEVFSRGQTKLRGPDVCTLIFVIFAEPRLRPSQAKLRSTIHV